MGELLKPVYSVSVRELVEFVLRTGDLGGARDFVGVNRALAGIRGHQKVQRSRPTGYQKEIVVSHDLDAGDFCLRIQGRLDGLMTTPDAIVAEEIKTVQGKWDRVADPLHWAQAKCYGFIISHDKVLKEINVRLTYLELESDEVTEFQEKFSFDELWKFFAATASVYLDWIREHRAWRQARDKSILQLAFPFPGYRPGQRELAVAAYRVLANGGRLFLEAPTGIGKTVSVLFPAMKAMGEGKLERIFYLTARTVGRSIAEKALNDLRAGGLQLRSITLTAKEKVCLRDGQPCDNTTCPLAQGYYDRRKPAMRAALEHAEITREILQTIAQEHQVCPFELSLDLSVWVDTVICDYNYVFDPQVFLRRHFAEGGRDCAFLVDEAHNLVDRAREMFSADLDSREVNAVRRAVKKVPGCARALSKLASAMRKLTAQATPGADTGDAPDDCQELLLLASELELRAKPKNFAKDQTENIRTFRESPVDFLSQVDNALEKVEAWLAQNQPAEFRGALLELFFRLFSFRRTADLFDDRYVTILKSNSAVQIRLFCLDPSFLLSEALKRGKAAVFFSATLSPVEYYRAMLGGEPADATLQLKSPFPSENLKILIHDRIATNFKARAASLAQVAEAIAAVVQGRRGNYLVYFPSYTYLNAVLEHFRSLCPETSILFQRPGMTERERDDFLAAFKTDHTATLVGFAVMGGVFGEGIDLIGERLIGAIIVGVGLPQLSAERDLIRDYFQDTTGDGFGYAYVFPGMNRVLQAAGRVIRSETDRGAILLIDTRFAEPRHRRLFPAWWRVARVRNGGEIRTNIQKFWESGNGSVGFSQGIS